MAEQTKLHGEAYGRGIWEHSVQVKEPADECYIPLENSNAAIYLFADKPDTCWDTAAGSTRLANRLKNAGYTKPVKLKIYEHGYHILLPDCVFMGRVAGMMFKEGKKYKKECRETRQDIQRTIKNALKTWK